MEATKAGVIVQRDVKVRMRDGTLLSANVYRPAGQGRYPVLLERVPYELEFRAKEYGEPYARAGYAVVVQNVRGMFRSGGVFSLGRNDADDGYDSVEWAAAQPWSNGAVGTLDGSYSGFTQLALAPTRPPHLRALYLRQPTADPYQALFRGGAHAVGFRRWILDSYLFRQLDDSSAPPGSKPFHERVKAALDGWHRWVLLRPLRDFPPFEGRAPWYEEVLDHPTNDDWWAVTDVSRRFGEIDVPAVHLGGWFDWYLRETLAMYRGLRHWARSERSRRGQQLVVGPWFHGPENVGQRRIGDFDFGPDAQFDYHAHRLRWYDHWLNDADNGVPNDPPLRLFLMGTNRWIEPAAWPPPGVVEQRWYLRADGALTRSAPPSDEPAAHYVHDPDAPAPVLAPLNGPLVDLSPLQPFGLVYTTEPLQQDLTVVGPLKLVLHASSSARDTDWVVHVADVRPDGRAFRVCHFGVLRARYRGGFDRAELMEPGRLYCFEIDAGATANVFKAGHRLRVYLLSSAVPAIEPNLGTGGDPAIETVGHSARNAVHHDASHASYLILPVLA